MSEQVRVIGCGSRGWEDRLPIQYHLHVLKERFGSKLIMVTGGAPGADRLIHEEAVLMSLICEVHYAKWDEHGRVAGFVRNAAMASLQNVVLCIAFWDGESRGTAHMLSLANKAGIPTEVVGV